TRISTLSLHDALPIFRAHRGRENPAVMTQARTQRLESEIQRALATLIARELKDPRVGNVTITAVSIAADMATARVFFTPFASQRSEEHTSELQSRGHL